MYISTHFFSSDLTPSSRSRGDSIPDNNTVYVPSQTRVAEPCVLEYIVHIMSCFRILEISHIRLPSGSGDPFHLIHTIPPIPRAGRSLDLDISQTRFAHLVQYRAMLPPISRTGPIGSRLNASRPSKVRGGGGVGTGQSRIRMRWDGDAMSLSGGDGASKREGEVGGARRRDLEGGWFV